MDGGEKLTLKEREQNHNSLYLEVCRGLLDRFGNSKFL